MTSPGYVVVMFAHALCAVIGFGALAATGSYARAVRISKDPWRSAVLQRFFRPGHNLASATIVAVPLLGATLLVMQRGRDLHLLYPWLGLGCWAVAAVASMTLVWPAERKMQQLLARSGEPERAAEDRMSLDGYARRCLFGAAITTLCFSIAFVAMLAQP